MAADAAMTTTKEDAIMENKTTIGIDGVLDGMETLRTGVEFVGLACAELDGRVPVGPYMPAVMRLIGEKVDALKGKLRDTRGT